MKNLALFILLSQLFTLDLFGIEIRTAAQRIPPKFFTVDEDGIRQIVGLEIEIMRALEQQDKGLTFIGTQEFLPTGRIFRYLEKGTLDVFFGAGSNEERRAKYKFVDPPLYQVSRIIAVRRSDDVNVKTFYDIQDLGQKGIIATMLNTGHHQYLKKQKGIILHLYKTIEEGFNKLDDHSIRFVFDHDLGINFVIKKELLSKSIKTLPTKFHTFNHYMIFSRKTPDKIVKRVQRALVAISEKGILKKIHAKYVN